MNSMQIRQPKNDQKLFRQRACQTGTDCKDGKKAVTKKRPHTRYLVGFMAKPMVLTQKIFGDRVYDWVIKKFS